MYDYSQMNYYPYNMYQNGGYGYQYPVFGTCLNNNQTLNTPQFDVNMCQDYGYQYPMHIDTRQSNQSVSTPQQNLNVQNLPNTVNFKASEQIQAKSQKEGLSTGAKWAIGIGVTTALAIGADFLFCKGKHVKNLWGKLKGNNSKPNDTTPGSSKPGGTNPGSTKPGTTKPDAVKPETVKPESVKPDAVKPETVKPETVKPESVKPDAVKPETVKPETVKPESVKPDAVKPETVKPETVKPEAVKPEAVKPTLQRSEYEFLTNLRQYKEKELKELRFELSDKEDYLLECYREKGDEEAIEVLEREIQALKEFIKDKEVSLRRIIDKIQKAFETKTSI